MEDLLLGHFGGEVGSHVVDAEAKAADAGLSAQLAGFNADSRIQGVHGPACLLTWSDSTANSASSPILRSAMDAG